MTIPADKKDRAIYHLILSEMHRLQGIMLNMQTIDAPDTAEALREHFTREQNVALGKLTEWRNRRPEIYREASEDFKSQAQTE